MTRDVSKFTTISPKKSGHVTYGDNNKGKINGIGKIGTNSSTPIENVLLVEGLKHSQLSVSQFGIQFGSLGGIGKEFWNVIISIHTDTEERVLY